MFLLLIIIYLAFISLGLPDAALGSAWPAISHHFNSSLEFAGLLALLISAGTVISSLFSTRIIHQFGTGPVVAVSVLMTAMALSGFTLAHNVWILALFAVPLGLGAGAVDAALNNFVALNYKSKHMNYLHSFWGVGATTGPLIMAIYLSSEGGWREGYSMISYIQFALVIVLFMTLPLWKKTKKIDSIIDDNKSAEKLFSNRMAWKMKGVKWQLILFCCYCSLEAGTGLWAASYLTIEKGISLTDAAFWTAMYFLGITVGRFICGFIADRVNGNILIRTGVVVTFIGVISLLMPAPLLFAKLGVVLIGFGCAPIYPNTIHLTPQRFGKQASQAIIGLSMAAAYIGTALLPPLMGIVLTSMSFAILPIILLIFCMLMLFFSERLKPLSNTKESFIDSLNEAPIFK